MFAEFVCPLLGYVEFLHSDWLDQIVAWQSPNGCYGQKKFAAKDSVKHDLQRALSAAEKADSNAFRGVGVHIQDERGNVVVQQKNELVYHKANSSAAGKKSIKQQPRSQNKNNMIVLSDPKLELAGNRMVQRDVDQRSILKQQPGSKLLPPRQNMAEFQQQQQIAKPFLGDVMQNRDLPVAPVQRSDSAGRPRPLQPNIAALPRRAVPLNQGVNRQQDSAQQQVLKQQPANQGVNQQWWQDRNNNNQYVQNQPIKGRRLLFEKDMPGWRVFCVL